MLGYGRNWTRAFRIAIWFGVLAAILLWLLLGCGQRGPNGIVYVPDTDQLFFVSPGDRLIVVDGNEVTIPYKGVILSNQRYIEILKGVDE